MFCLLLRVLLQLLSRFEQIFTTMHFARFLCVHLLGCVRFEHFHRIQETNVFDRNSFSFDTYGERSDEPHVRAWQTHVLEASEGTPMPPPRIRSTSVLGSCSRAPAISERGGHFTGEETR
ncbi:MAG: hypothetical protein FRX48_03745 [Lasallia pustulata]|uniref:Secreted protein n=1 Tax=Lasallia pustulata TaxID=136370 RepID=A0A5M8PVN8_9LECA|nr:MAG: hypothetical protein FRX48_03745 [Lasallia pustulata]